MEKLKIYLFGGLSFTHYDPKVVTHEKQHTPIVGAFVDVSFLLWFAKYNIPLIRHT